MIAPKRPRMIRSAKAKVSRRRTERKTVSATRVTAKFRNAMHSTRNPKRYRGIHANEVRLLARLQRKFGLFLENLSPRLLARYNIAAQIGTTNLLYTIRHDTERLEKLLARK